MAAATDILVIEDDPILRELLGDWLLAAGYGVRIARDGVAGIAAARASRPSLVITDLRMPGILGASVITEIHRDHPAVPVIAISGSFGTSFGITVEQAIALGAAFALRKPFGRGEAIAAIARLLTEADR